MANLPRRKFSKATRDRMSRSHTGLKLSQATKDKISAARRERQALIEMGLLEPFRHTEATKRHLSRVMKRKKHKPTRKALRTSARNRAARKADKTAERHARKLL